MAYSTYSSLAAQAMDEVWSKSVYASTLTVSSGLTAASIMAAQQAQVVELQKPFPARTAGEVLHDINGLLSRIKKD